MGMYEDLLAGGMMSPATLAMFGYTPTPVAAAVNDNWSGGPVNAPAPAGNPYADPSVAYGGGTPWNGATSGSAGAGVGAGTDLGSYVDGLYSKYAGKTGDLIDQEGRNYWMQQAQKGDITDAFKGSVKAVYTDPTAYTSSPYAEQNIAGMQNLAGYKPQPTPKPVPLPGQAGTPQAGQGGTNPYLTGVADDMQRRSQFGLQQAFNGIRSNAVGVGGLGGSRQGVAEGIATGMANDGLTGNIANLYSNNWNQQQGRDLQKYGLDLGYDTQNRGLDLESIRTGAQVYGVGSQGPWQSLGNASNIYGNYTGFGSNTSSSNQGGGWQGAVGGALGAAQLAKNFGWW